MPKSTRRRTRSKKLKRSKKQKRYSNKRKSNIRKRKSNTKKINQRKRKRKSLKGGFTHFYIPEFQINGLNLGNKKIDSLKIGNQVGRFVKGECI